MFQHSRNLRHYVGKFSMDKYCPSHLNCTEVAVSDMVCRFPPNRRNFRISDSSSCPWFNDADTRCLSCIPCVAYKYYPVIPKITGKHTLQNLSPKLTYVNSAQFVYLKKYNIISLHINRKYPYMYFLDPAQYK